MRGGGRRDVVPPQGMLQAVADAPDPSVCLRQTPPLKGEALLYCPLKAPLVGELAAQRPEGFGTFRPHGTLRAKETRRGQDPALQSRGKGAA